MFRIVCLLFGLLSPTAIWSQSLRVQPSSREGKTTGSFSVVMTSPSGKAPVALQWEFLLPSMPAIGVADITAGKAAESAGKSIGCAPGVKQASKVEGVRYTSLVAGVPNER